MSGGTFGYKDGVIYDVAEDIDLIIKRNHLEDEYGFASHYSDATITQLERAVRQLRLASIFTHRIDYLEAGDDSEASFHRRLKEDLESSGL